MKTGIDISIPVVPDIENMDGEVMKQMNLDNPVSTKDPLGDFHFPGWYRDIEGALCIVIKERLVSVRYDKETQGYHVCVDALGPHGLFNKNLMWGAFDDALPAKHCALNAIERICYNAL